MLDNNHRTVPLTEHGRQLPKSWPERWSYDFRRVRVTLKPGETITSTFDLSNIYALRNPGTYTVAVSRSLAATADRPSLTAGSDIVTLTLE